MSATIPSTAAKLRVGEIATTGVLRVGSVQIGKADAPPLASVRYELSLQTAGGGWQLAIADASNEIGTVSLAREATPARSSGLVAALIPEDSTVGRLLLRWGDYQATTDVQFTNPSRRRTDENGLPNTTTSRTHDEDTSELSRVRLLAQRNETAIVLPNGARTSVSFQRTFARGERAEGVRPGVGLGVDGPDFARLSTTPDGQVVMLSESAVPRLRIEVPLRFGTALIATGNQVTGFPGSYGLWLKRVGSGWRLVFNNEPDVWGSQHDPKADAAEVALSHTEGHVATRPFSVALVPTAPDRGRLVVSWGPHEWAADFAVAG